MLGAISAGVSAAQGLMSIGGSLFGGGGGGGLFGGGGDELSPEEEAALEMQMAQYQFGKNIYNKYNQLYQDYYWPIEEFQAGNYLTDIKEARPYEERMRDYQLGRGDELIQLAQDTNSTLDENKKSLIRRLTEGEDVLADRYRSQATADVAAAYGQQKNALNQQMSLYGVNPNSGAWANQNTSMAQNQALNMAGARTQATRQAEDTSLQRQAQALNYYTNPSMLYDYGTITPGLSVSQALGGSGGGGVGQSATGGSGSTSGSSGGLNGLFSGMSMLGGGLDYFSNTSSGLGTLGKAFGNLFTGASEALPAYNPKG